MTPARPDEPDSGTADPEDGAEDGRGSNAALRRRLRDRRRALAPSTRERSAAGLARRMQADVAELATARRVALHLADDGEIDPARLTANLVDLGVEISLPSARADGTLDFAVWEPGAPLVPDRWHIPVPSAPPHIRQAVDLDIILVPLVAVDRDGYRLGRGGGFYDRTLAHRLDRAGPPLVVGTGHDFQVVDHPIERHEDDVPLDVLVTESLTRRWERNRERSRGGTK